MTRFTLPILAAIAFASLPSPNLGAPSLPLALCQNEPYTHIVAGTRTPIKRSPPSSNPNSTLLCAPNSTTYITLTTITTTPSIDTRLLRPVISTAYQNILHTIAPPSKDRIISSSPGWIFNTTVGAYELKVKNAGTEFVPLWLYGLTAGALPATRRKMTYKVLRDALLALYVFMNDKGWRLGEFEVYDQGKMVGFGVLGGVK
ncbi:MAG: hypothetical protein Q9188_002006 [Gyalolechia gomerana]